MEERMEDRAEVVVRYDGPALANGEMAAEDLALVITGINDLCVTANRYLNSGKAEARVLVDLNVEQKCVRILFELIIENYQNLTSFLEQDSVKDAKNILEWLGLIGGLTAGGVFGFYKFAYGTEICSDEQADNAQRNIVTSDGTAVQIYGDSNSVHVGFPTDKDPMDFANLSTTQKSAEYVLAPMKREGCEKVSFEAENAESFYITRQEAKRIRDQFQALRDDAAQFEDARDTMQSVSAAIEATGPPQTMVAQLRVKRPVYEGNSRWSFIHQGREIQASMEDRDFLDDVQTALIVIPARSSLLVDLATSPDGKAYTITKVHKLVPPAEQLTLLRASEPNSHEE